MINWINQHKRGLIRGMFLIPIILVMIISISHVVGWYSLSNPMSWAIYLSIAIEVAAMSSISAASVKIKGGVWLVFLVVSLVQFIGNIFFCYKETNINSEDFKSWVELTQPVFEMLGSDVKDIIAQRRWLALLEGGLLPVISMASLHFFIKYGGMDEEVKPNPVVNTPTDQVTDQVTDQPVSTPAPEIETPAEPVSTPAIDTQKALAINMARIMGGG